MNTTTTTTLNSVDLEAVAGLAGKIQDSPEVAATVWKADVTWNEGFRSSASIRDFDVVGSDEPSSLGGTDTAPNPVEQLLGALGNCLAVGYAANASVAGIEIDDLRIEVEGNLDLHTFLGLNPDGNAGFDTIGAKVFLQLSASAEEIEKLHQTVTDTSPVGHTLAREVPLEIELG